MIWCQEAQRALGYMVRLLICEFGVRNIVYF